MGGLGTGTVLAGCASSKYSDDLNFAAAARQIASKLACMVGLEGRRRDKAGF
jgi:hypothetical protein